jgi:hypothetical protein
MSAGEQSLRPPHGLAGIRCMSSRESDDLHLQNRSYFVITERGGFEPPKQLMAIYTISSRAPSAGLGHLSHKACSRALPLRSWQLNSFT